MAKIKLQKNDLFIIVEHENKDYFQFQGLPISTDFKHLPSDEKFAFIPETYQCESDIEIEVSHDQYVTDIVFGGNLPGFVGPRPRNIVRR